MNGRQEAFGQSHRPTYVDRLGIFLSNRRILALARRTKPRRVLDLGCGYHAKLLKLLSPYCDELVGVDVAVSVEESTEQIKLIPKRLEQDLAIFKDSSFEMVILNNVLEHLMYPHHILQECYRILTGEGLLMVNVPTWLGKAALEFSAFRLGLSPAIEMDDHKMYYAKRDLWPLLVRAGFKPSRIRLRYHKLWLCVFGIIQK